MGNFKANLRKKYDAKSTVELKQLRTYYKCNWMSFSIAETKYMRNAMPIIEELLKERNAYKLN